MWELKAGSATGAEAGLEANLAKFDRKEFPPPTKKLIQIQKILLYGEFFVFINMWELNGRRHDGAENWLEDFSAEKY